MTHKHNRGFKRLRDEKPKGSIRCILLERYSSKSDDRFEQYMGVWSNFKQAFTNNDGEILPTPELWKECEDYNGMTCEEFYESEFDEKDRYKSCQA